MAKQLRSKRVRGIVSYAYHERDMAGEHMYETNTDYLNKHADEWKPPLGEGRHMHLIYSKQVHWRIVEQGSSVCAVPGRCFRVDIQPATPECTVTDCDGSKGGSE